MVYKIINYGDLFTAAVALIVFGIVYLTYRQSIQQINNSVEQAEEAERQRAELERTRRVEAEEYAKQITGSPSRNSSRRSPAGTRSIQRSSTPRCTIR